MCNFLFASLKSIIKNISTPKQKHANFSGTNGQEYQGLNKKDPLTQEDTSLL